MILKIVYDVERRLISFSRYCFSTLVYNKSDESRRRNNSWKSLTLISLQDLREMHPSGEHGRAEVKNLSLFCPLKRCGLCNKRNPLKRISKCSRNMHFI